MRLAVVHRTGGRKYYRDFIAWSCLRLFVSDVQRTKKRLKITQYSSTSWAIDSAFLHAQSQPHQEIRNYMRLSLPLKKSKWIFQRQSNIWWVIQDQDLRLRRFVQHQTKGKGKRRHNTDGSHFGPRKNKPKGIMAGRNDRPLQNQSIRHSRRDRRQVVMPTRPYSRIPKLYSNGYIRWYFEGWRTWRVIMEGSVWRCNDDGRRFHSLIRSL